MEYHDENNDTFVPLTFYDGSGSGVSGSGSALEVPPNSASLPLPVAGVTYFFRIITTNDRGSNITDCPSIFLTTGI